MIRKSAVVIPARYASSRFPGKPLAQILGKPMIQHVWERANASHADVVLVATDDERIAAAVQNFGGTAVMTRADHPSGTDRIAEAVEKCGIDPDIIVNVQGDEPLMPTSVIDGIIDLMRQDPECEMATVAVPGVREKMTSDNVKVVMDNSGRALYFSRAEIPFVRTGGVAAPIYLHWGIYAYRRDTLQKFVRLPAGILENSEKLEQLRALENGIAIKVIVSELESIGVDTPADLAKAEAKLREFNRQ